MLENVKFAGHNREMNYSEVFQTVYKMLPCYGDFL